MDFSLPKSEFVRYVHDVLGYSISRAVVDRQVVKFLVPSDIDAMAVRVSATYCITVFLSRQRAFLDTVSHFSLGHGQMFKNGERMV